MIAVSDSAKKSLLDFVGAKPAKIETIYNPFDFSKIRVLADENNDAIPKEKFVLHAARFDLEQKRQDVLFEAFKQVKTPCKLVLLTKKSNPLQNLIDSYGLNDRIIIAGFQNNPYNWFKKAELSVLCSDYEGLGNVIIESLVCGTPVVSTSCPSGPAEILTGESAQWLVPVNSPDTLAEKIDEALNTAIEIDEKIITKFRDDIIANQYLDLIHS